MHAPLSFVARLKLNTQTKSEQQPTWWDHKFNNLDSHGAGVLFNVAFWVDQVWFCCKVSERWKNLNLWNKLAFPCSWVVTRSMNCTDTCHNNFISTVNLHKERKNLQKNQNKHPFWAQRLDLIWSHLNVTHHIHMGLYRDSLKAESQMPQEPVKIEKYARIFQCVVCKAGDTPQLSRCLYKPSSPLHYSISLLLICTCCLFAVVLFRRLQKRCIISPVSCNVISGRD